MIFAGAFAPFDEFQGNWTAVLAVIVAGAVGFGVYVGDYYHADDAAQAAMESTDAVAVYFRQQENEQNATFILNKTLTCPSFSNFRFYQA
ncbi:MAG: hypothetical protein DBY20_01485 [Coriobacteriia bacterium]|nr:MAG: hypothetical protein DBY20_01485 [Coriobacteriia bacterium]